MAGGVVTVKDGEFGKQHSEAIHLADQRNYVAS
jgi:hypothetical protein